MYDIMKTIESIFIMKSDTGLARLQQQEDKELDLVQ